MIAQGESLGTRLCVLCTYACTCVGISQMCLAHSLHMYMFMYVTKFSTFLHPCTCTYMYMYIHVHVHVYRVHVCTCTCTCVSCTCMYMYMYMCIVYMYVHVYIMPYMEDHVCSLARNMQVPICQPASQPEANTYTVHE